MDIIAAAERVNQKVDILKQIVTPSQLTTMMIGAGGEEANYFREKLNSIVETFEAMPVTYEQDGKGDDAIVYLHYFHAAGWDWYVTEKDIEDGVTQAFGLVDGDYCELGYISITEIVNAGAELDIHWTPKKLGTVRKAIA